MARITSAHARCRAVCTSPASNESPSRVRLPNPTLKETA